MKQSPFRIEVLEANGQWQPVNPDQVACSAYLLFQEATRRSENNQGVHFRIAREGSKRAALRFYVKPGQVKP